MTPQPNPTARTINPEPGIKAFTCPHCHKPVAETNGTSLKAGMLAFPFPVTATCQYCGGMVKWRPVVNGNGSDHA